MKILLAGNLCLLLLVVGALSVGAQAPGVSTAVSQTMTISINDQETVSASLHFDLESLNEDSNRNATIIPVAIPFEISDQTTIVPSQDTRVAVISKGDGYTILAVFPPQVNKTISIQLEKIAPLADAGEGRAKLEFDPSYQLADPHDKALVTAPTTLSTWDYSIVLPKEYDRTDVAYAPSSMTWPNKRTLAWSSTQSLESGTPQIMLAIPSSRDEQTLVGEIIVAFILGILTLSLESYQFRRSFRWQVFVFLMATILLASSIYFGVILGLNKTFLAAVAFAAPYAIVSLYFCIYMFAARYFEATIEGRVSSEDEPLSYATFSLAQIGTPPKEIFYRPKELEDGRFVLRLWLWNVEKRCRLVVAATGTEPYESEILTLNGRARYQIGTIRLRVLPAVGSAGLPIAQYP